MSEPSMTPSVNASKDKTGETPTISKDHVKIDASSEAAGDENVSCAEDMMTENVEGPSTEGLCKNVDSSVKDIVDGWKDSTFLEEDVLEPSIANTITECMDNDIPSIDGIEPVIASAIGKVTPSVTDTATETVDQEEIDTMDADVEDMTLEKASQEKKKSNKRRLRKLADTVETSEPKKKLSKEKRAAKRDRKAERRSRNATDAKTTQDNDVEEVVPEETEEKELQGLILTGPLGYCEMRSNI
ncbi:hypothetical protein LIER_08087 [Lithospermum erythrorhizon]|uniref:Uncharacterized protein n=1 Tax=Lithospermum erythrorhizon TaxID=34254 RepID=A0AAV3PCN4_LITER